MIKVTVREAAEGRGIKSAAELARLLGYESRTIAGRLWNPERGELPRLETLDRVAEALGCDLSELVTRVPDKKGKGLPLRKSGPKKKRAK